MFHPAPRFLIPLNIRGKVPLDTGARLDVSLWIHSGEDGTPLFLIWLPSLLGGSPVWHSTLTELFATYWVGVSPFQWGRNSLYMLYGNIFLSRVVLESDEVFLSYFDNPSDIEGLRSLLKL
jgi:hypothetical protein